MLYGTWNTITHNLYTAVIISFMVNFPFFAHKYNYIDWLDNLALKICMQRCYVYDCTYIVYIYNCTFPRSHIIRHAMKIVGKFFLRHDTTLHQNVLGTYINITRGQRRGRIDHRPNRERYLIYICILYINFKLWKICVLD